MTKCLVTKLNGNVQDDSLLKVGEMRCDIKKKDSITPDDINIILTFSKNANVSIIGDSYFRDLSGTQNLGKTASFSANAEKRIYVNNNDAKFSIGDKYSLIMLASGNCFKNFDINELKWSPKLAKLSLGDCHGELETFKNSTEMLIIILYGNVTGNISAISQLKNLTTLTIYSNYIKGDLSSLIGLTNLETVILDGAELSGDLATLPSKCYFFEAIDTEYKHINHLTWASNRPSSSTIIAINEIWLDSYVDKMLINQAECQVGFKSNSPNWHKKIACHGTRTSASDAAVAKLQAKGYTVVVNP